MGFNTSDISFELFCWAIASIVVTVAVVGFALWHISLVERRSASRYRADMIERTRSFSRLAE